MIGGGEGNFIDAATVRGTIDGGSNNSIGQSNYDPVIGGGRNNAVSNDTYYVTIAGGVNNKIHDGVNNGTVGGGFGNVVQSNADNAVIAGGYRNTIQTNADYGFIGGGVSNVVMWDADKGMILGGELCTVSNAASYSLAAGRRAKAGYSGSFVWADSQNADFGATAADQVSFRCLGGVRFSSGTGGLNQQVSWAPGGAAWTFTSDREKKEGFENVDAAAVLEKVAALPLSWWRYIGYDVKHIGPMAQDFHAAFDLGRDEKGIDGADLDGVALAAIQGLYKENQGLKARVAELERKVDLLMGKLPQ